MSLLTSTPFSKLTPGDRLALIGIPVVVSFDGEQAGGVVSSYVITNGLVSFAFKAASHGLTPSKITFGLDSDADITFLY